MQVTVTCPDCAGFISQKVDSGTVIQAFHICNGEIIRGEKQRAEIRILELSNEGKQ